MLFRQLQPRNRNGPGQKLLSADCIMWIVNVWFSCASFFIVNIVTLVTWSWCSTAISWAAQWLTWTARTSSTGENSGRLSHQLLIWPKRTYFSFSVRFDSISLFNCVFLFFALISTPCLGKKQAKLFLLKLRQTSTKYDNFGTKMANSLKLYEVHSFSTSPNLRQCTSVLNPDVPNCYITL